MKQTFWRYFTIAVFTGLYSYIIPYGFITIEPCANTPGHNYTAGFILTGLFPLLLGILFYFLFRHKTVFRVKTFFKSVALAAGWLAASVVLFTFLSAIAYFFIDRPYRIIPYISEYGCYNDIVLTRLAEYILWFGSNIITGFVIIISAQRRMWMLFLLATFEKPERQKKIQKAVKNGMKKTNKPVDD
jgi:heme/copper-type cytochrome/quinol oxidase subunit 2